MRRPPIVTPAEWQQARDELLVAEKEATRALDALAARRRRLPMVEFDTGYTFDTPAGPESLTDLFDGRDQLVVYQLMDNGPDHYCPGCSWYTDNVPSTAPELLAESGVTYVHASNMPLAQIEKYRAWMGFSLSVFLRDGDQVYLTYTTTSRGIDRLAFVNNILDLTPYGRQEEWEDSPSGWPRHPTSIVPNTIVLGMRATSYGRFR
jgi:predicted dithiol-disulfide oxidoreductase (DUF899 family)